MGIFGLLSGLVSVLLFFLKKSNEKKTPKEIHEDEKNEFNEHLANGDALGMSVDFDRMRNEIESGRDTSGQGDSED